jgi:50S ribosomal protein L16 3-hydroxylase
VRTCAYNAGMKKLTLLGGITPAVFLRDYWQKKPLLVRQAIPDFASVLTPAALFALAGRDDVDSRMVTRSNRRWDLQDGPFPDLCAGTEAARDWTLLVQGVNLHDAAADALLRQFRFIPDTRLDDLMISYAVDGGGVGPHVDSYDVFLLQTHGQRRWRISAQQDLRLVEGLPLKILRHFVAEQEFILEPGDMLYLPPQYAHEGVALGECMTCSIGFRAPVYQELGGAFLQFMADSIELPGRYTDPGRKPTNHPARIDSDLLAGVSAALQNVRFTPDDIAIFLGEYLSEPKANVVFAAPAQKLPAARFAKQAALRGVAVARKTQMLYRGKHLFINGESFGLAVADRAILGALADARALTPAQMVGLSVDVAEALYLWYCDGWIWLQST